ncbi:MAG: T9SS type A sorting domain-containing protein [Flavobacteriales bacterium]
MRGRQLRALLAYLLLLMCARDQLAAQTPVVRAYDQGFNKGIRLANGEHVFTGGGEWWLNVIQLDSLGEVLWGRQLSPGVDYLGMDLTAPVGTADGHVLVGATHHGPEGFAQPAVLCFDHDGNVLWAKTYLMADTMRAGGLARTTDGMNLLTAIGGSASAPYSVLIKIHDDGAVEWARSSGQDWSAGFVTPLTNGELLVNGLVLVDADGTVEWSMALDSEGNSQSLFDAAETPSGNLVVMTGNVIKQGVDEFTLFTMDRDGQRLAGRSYDTGPVIGDMLTEGDVLVNPLGQIAVLARTNYPVCHMLLLDSAYSTLWSVRYNEAPLHTHWVPGVGNEAWLSLAGWAYPGELHRIPLAAAPEGPCYLPPTIVPGTTFTGPVPFLVTLSPYEVDTTSFIAITAILPVTPMPFPCFTTGIAGIEARVRPALGPNPASDHVNVTGVAVASSWTLHDAAGRALRAGVLPADGRIGLQGLATGMYVLFVQEPQGTWSQCLVVE